MKRNLSFAFILSIFFFCNISKAQYAFIPDTNFRNFLMNGGFAGCMLGDSLDTTCTAVVNATSISCSYQGIHDLTGIKYFDAINTLNCMNNYLTFLPELPASLLTLNCQSNSLPAIYSLPPNLYNLNCSYNTIVYLPNLPASLLTFKCSENQLSSLPGNLPLSLIEISCDNNLLSNFPYFDSLPNLTILRCDHNQLTNWPFFSGNFELPSLMVFDCSFNQLNSTGNIPLLPGSLMEFYCNNNYLTSLPQPQSSYSLEQLNCSFNQLSVLQYPSSVTWLDCSNNMLTFFPSIQFTALTWLNCSHNYLTALPNSYFNMTNLDCSYNLITLIPDFPEVITTLDISNNPISCLPQIFTIGNLIWTNTNITCLPNIGYINYSTPSVYSLPICQITDSCPAIWSIIGQVFFDTDSSCTRDTSEVFLKEIPVILDSGGVQLQGFITDNLGRYSFLTGIGNYSIRIDTTAAAFRVVCPASFSQPIFLTVTDSMETVPSFGLLCNNGFDLVARSISPAGIFSVGHSRALYLNAGEGMSFSGISCIDSGNGFVQAIIQGLISYISPASGALTPTSVSGDTITWIIADYSLVDPAHDFNIIVEVSTSATINDSVCVQLSVLPTLGDNIPSNNTLSECFPIHSAVDPNEKYMFPSGLVDTVQQWFNFTIFFQNTGNAPAEDIYILDTLDQNLDPTTFTYLSSSHQVITQLLPGNILRFNYPDIFLTDSTTNEPASHGYVKFKVKRQAGIPLNTSIENTAHIFFDFNAPVATNTVSATFVSTVGMPPANLSHHRLYPNPAGDKLFIYDPGQAIQSIQIFSITGVMHLKDYTLTSQNQSVEIKVGDMAPGVYLLRMIGNQGVSVKRFIKQ